MPITSITYTDKQIAVDPENPVIPIEKWMAVDANEVKNVVNTLASGVLSPTTETDDYTLVLADTFIILSKATAVNLTIPPHSSVAFPTNKYIPVLQGDAGTITFVAGSGVTIEASSGELTSPGENSIVGLLQTAENVWRLINGNNGTVVDWSTGLNPQGWSSFTAQKCYYIDRGKSIFITGIVHGTGNGGTTVTITLPIAPNSTYYTTDANNQSIIIQSAGPGGTTGMITLTGGSITANAYNSAAGAGFTASNFRLIRFSFEYFK